MTFTPTPLPYTSCAKPVVKRSKAALHMPYTVPPCPPGAFACGWMAAWEEMFRIQPAPRSSMDGRHSCASSNGPHTCTSSMMRKRFSEKSFTGMNQVTAALLTRMSTGP